MAILYDVGDMRMARKNIKETKMELGKLSRIYVNAELMHNWPHHKTDYLCNLLPENVKAALTLQHKEHSRGLNVRKAAEKVCGRFPDYLEFGFC